MRKKKAKVVPSSVFKRVEREDITVTNAKPYNDAVTYEPKYSFI